MVISTIERNEVPVRFMKRPHLVLCLFAGALFFSVLGSQAASLSISPDYFAVLRSGDARRLREALDGGASAEARDEKGNTALMHATVYGNLACMRLLLDRGANVNATNDAGATPLMRAAFDYEKLKLLVERGADVKARSAIGNSVLMLAARPHSSHRAVELLLAHGVDAAATNRFGANALMAAVAGGDIKSVRLLLKHGATVAAQGPPNPENFILGGGRSPLMWAAFRGEVEILNLLIEAGANVNGEDLLGTPLAQAAWSDQTAAARVLIERGAQVNQVDHGAGFAPLHWAASTEESSAEFVKLLLKHGADPNLGGGEPVDAFMDVLQTPLMLAKRRGDTATLATLMAAGATNETPDRVRAPALPARHLPARLDRETVRAAIAAAMPPLQQTAIASKKLSRATAAGRIARPVISSICRWPLPVWRSNNE